MNPLQQLLLFTATSFIAIIPATSSLADRSPSASDQKDCNFLQQWHKEIPELKFAKCEVDSGESVESGQKPAMTAVYSMKGRDAAKVEAFLQKQFGMGKLRFICCYWGHGPNYGSYRDKAYPSPHMLSAPYRISMSSGETVEKQWQRIDTFQVHILKYISDP